MLSAFFPPTLGGIETYVYELSKMLVKKGHTVQVVARYSPGMMPPARVEIRDGIQIYWLLSKKQKKLPTSIAVLSSPKFWWPVITSWSKGIMYILSHRNDFDLIHTHSVVPITTIGSFISLITRKPVVSTVHESHFLNGLSNVMYRIVARLSLSQCKGIICSSKELTHETESVQPGRKAMYIPNGIDHFRFKPKKNDYIRAITKISAKDKIALCIRRLDAEKNGVKYLLQSIPYVVKKRKDIKFVFIGPGMTKEEALKIISQKFSTYIYFLGPKNNSELPEYYTSCDFTILPSLKESVSFSGLESLSCAKPLVGTNVGGIPEIVKEGKTGFLCNPADPKDMARAILKMLDSDTKKLGKNGRVLIEETYSWDKIADRILDVYISAVNTQSL